MRIEVSVPKAIAIREGDYWVTQCPHPHCSIGIHKYWAGEDPEGALGKVACHAGHGDFFMISMDWSEKVVKSLETFPYYMSGGKNMANISEHTFYMATAGGVLTVRQVRSDGTIVAIESKTGAIRYYSPEEFSKAAMYVLSREQAKEELRGKSR